MPLRIGIVGAAGRMGSELVRACVKDNEVQLVMAIGRTGGQDVGAVCGLGNIGLIIKDNLEEELTKCSLDVAVVLTGVDGESLHEREGKSSLCSCRFNLVGSERTSRLVRNLTYCHTRLS